MAVKIQLRRGSASYWTAANPILAQGELGVELDTKKFKIGDGTSTWVLLGYSSGAVSFVDFSEVDDTTVGNPNDGDFLQYSTSTAKWIATTTVKTLQILSPVPSTSPTTGGLVVTGGIGVTGDVNIAGNISFSGTATVSANSGVFYGDEYGFAALYAGITGYTPLDQTIFQITANTSTFGQINFQNINTGSDASADFVITGATGTQDSNYISLGINSPNYNNPDFNVGGSNDGYLYIADGNLTIGTASPEKILCVHIGGTTGSDITTIFYPPNTISTDSNSGALVVKGGVGIQDNVVIGSTQTSTSTITENALYVAGGLGVQGNLNLAGGLNAITDIVAPTPVDGSVLVYSNSINKWVATTDLEKQNVDGGFY